MKRNVSRLAMTPLIFLAMTVLVQANGLPKLSVHGKDLVDPSGQKVSLRGCNLGNWMMIELWMLGLDEKCGATDQHSLFALLDKRFGRKTREALMTEYRSRWITDRDFDIIKSFRFNVVRLPMDYRLFEDDERPKHLRKDAFKWVDKCVQMAEKHGIYVILDMHGVQGGQSENDHTGESKQNKFWTNAEDQARAAWLWEKVAAHYRDKNTVVAYDPMNEPYGGTHELEQKAYPMLYSAIRKSDPDKLVYFHGHYDGFEYYGDPKTMGWHNVGFQMHYYPGLFGNGKPSLSVHQRHLLSMARIAQEVDDLNVPFIVGEMNPVFSSLGADMMRRHYDLYASYGWTTTMWSYKLATTTGGTEGGSWGMQTNVKPLRPINFAKDSLASIHRWIKGLNGSNWQPYDNLRKAMAPEIVTYQPLPTPDPVRTTVPPTQPVPGLIPTDLGTAMPGSTEGDLEELALYGAGNDVWADTDECRYLHTTVRGDFTAEVTIKSMDDLQMYAKAGWMVRDGLDSHAAHVSLTSWSDGTIQMIERPSKGANTKDLGTKEGTIGQSLKLVRKGSVFVGYARQAGKKDWVKVSETTRPDLPASVEIGLIACSHDSESYIKVGYEKVRIIPADPNQ